MLGDETVAPFCTVTEACAELVSFRCRFSVTVSGVPSTSKLPPPAARPIRRRRTLPLGGPSSWAVPPFSTTASSAVGLPAFGTPRLQLPAVFQLPVPSVQIVCAKPVLTIGERNAITVAQEIAIASCFAFMRAQSIRADDQKQICRAEISRGTRRKESGKTKISPTS